MLLLALALASAAPPHACFPMPAELLPTAKQVKELPTSDTPVQRARLQLLDAAQTGQRARVWSAVAELKNALAQRGVTPEDRAAAERTTAYVLGHMARDCTCHCCGRLGHQGEEPLAAWLDLFPQGALALPFRFFLGEEARSNTAALPEDELRQHQETLRLVAQSSAPELAPLAGHAREDLERVETALAQRRELRVTARWIAAPAPGVEILFHNGSDKPLTVVHPETRGGQGTRAYTLLSGSVGPQHAARVKTHPTVARTLGWTLLDLEPGAGTTVFVPATACRGDGAPLDWTLTYSVDDALVQRMRGPGEKRRHIWTGGLTALVKGMRCQELELPFFALGPPPEAVTAALSLVSALRDGKGDPAEQVDVEAALLMAPCLGDFETPNLEHCTGVEALLQTRRSAQDRKAALERVVRDARGVLDASCVPTGEVTAVVRKAWRVGTVDVAKEKSLAPPEHQTVYAAFVATVEQERTVELQCAGGRKVGVTVLRRQGDSRWRLGVIGHD